MHGASQSRGTRYLGGARRMQALLILEALEVATLILGAQLERVSNKKRKANRHYTSKVCVDGMRLLFYNYSVQKKQVGT